VLKHVRAVIVEIGVLLPAELADADSSVDPPRVQEFVANLWNDD
jgi:hypothetical protein